MRRTRLARFLTAMFGIWFTFTLIEPTGMIGMTMIGMTMTGDSAPIMAMSMSNGMPMAGMRMAAMEMSGAATSDMAAQSQESMQSQHTVPEQSSAPPECDRHDCCCSAVPFATLSPEATLAWLPDHVINQDAPRHGDFVAYTNGQHLLPFANGPPLTVSA